MVYLLTKITQFNFDVRGTAKTFVGHHKPLSTFSKQNFIAVIKLFVDLMVFYYSFYSGQVYANIIFGCAKTVGIIWWRLRALERRLHKFIQFQGRGRCSQIADRVLAVVGVQPVLMLASFLFGLVIISFSNYILSKTTFPYVLGMMLYLCKICNLLEIMKSFIFRLLIFSRAITNYVSRLFKSKFFQFQSLEISFIIILLVAQRK